MNIPRYYQHLDEFLLKNKVNILYGPRQVGKTTLIQNYLKSLKNTRYLNKTGDELALAEIFSKLSIQEFKNMTEGVDLLVINEAQLLPNIGRGLKIIIDHLSPLQVIVTGSASFDLVNKVGEPLTGRDNILYLYPIAQLELLTTTPQFELQQQLQSFLLYGSYPEVMLLPNKQKEKRLDHIVNSYLIKDVLALENIKGSVTILNLLRLIAFQIGSEVSTSELANKLGNITEKTVKKYLDLLEKAFVLIRVGGFSRNLRKEISKSSRYYFWDTGIRNALIKNFNSLELRDDVGMLWENFLVVERLKKQTYYAQRANNYFWRTYDQKEIDWVEERAGKLSGYEFKWGKKIPKAPKDWLETYDNSSYTVINKSNYFDFII